jgi:hypothetical protein
VSTAENYDNVKTNKKNLKEDDFVDFNFLKKRKSSTGLTPSNISNSVILQKN